MADFRSDRMPSPEGEGRAKDALEAAWEKRLKSRKAINTKVFAAMPEVKNVLKGYASARMFDAIGFWVMWQLNGGFEGLQKATGLSRSGMFRRIALFREVFGEHPDVYEFPGLTVDPVAFVEGMNELRKKKAAEADSQS